MKQTNPELLEADKRDIIYVRETLSTLKNMLSTYEKYPKMAEMYPKKYEDTKVLFEKYLRFEAWLSLEIIYGDSPDE